MTTKRHVNSGFTVSIDDNAYDRNNHANNDGGRDKWIKIQKGDNNEMKIDHDYDFDVGEVVTLSKNPSISVLNMSKLWIPQKNEWYSKKFIFSISVKWMMFK